MSVSKPERESFPWRRTLAMTTVGGLIAPTMQIWFDRSWTWEEVGYSTFYAMIYSNAVGILASALFYAVEHRLSNLGSTRAWTAVIGLLVVAAIGGSLLGSAVIWASGIYPSAQFWGLVRSSFRFCLPICLGIGIVTGLLEQTRDRLKTTELQLRTKELERERAEKLITEARLSSLESRVHPHFLFNVLNSISSLVREDPGEAERLIERMARLLRFSLDANQSGVVTLEQELKIVADYLEIERARFGARLAYSLDVPPTLQVAEVPPMSVQTLVENSVKYAVAPRREGGRITVSARRENGTLEVTVRDNGPGFTPERITKGHGLDLLQARLHTIFGDGAGLCVEGSAVSMRMPARIGVAA